MLLMLKTIARRHPKPRTMKRASIIGFGGSVLLHLSLLWSGAAQAAETLVVNISSLEFSVEVDSLEHYAATGEIRQDFADVAAYLTDEQLQDLRKGLVARVDLDPVTVSRFLYSSQGELVLKEAGRFILSRKRQSGFYAIRAALILAAADAEYGLTPLNVMRQFPVDGIRINSARVFDLLNDAGEMLAATNTAIAAIETQSQAARVQDAAFPRDLRQPGSNPWITELLELNDESRDRIFPVDLYLPPAIEGQKRPLVVISHGLGSDRTTFQYLAEHLASHGFAVAMPEHLGSNAAQLQALATGRARELTPPQELIDRPLDIQFLLDYLTAQYGAVIETDRVGVIGQSFGAYTALALAGAEINLAGLEATCPDADYSLNWSLVLQCAALKIEDPIPQLADDRVAAIIAINPLMSQIFGAENLEAIAQPTMLVSGADDAVTPALMEQIRPFATLTSSEKYLALLTQGTHFSTLAESENDIALPGAVLGPDPEIAQAYVRALGLSFFTTYVTGSSALKNHLSSSYTHQISNSENPLLFIDRDLPPLQE